MNTLKPEVVVITGASAGIGRATVQAFAKRGALPTVALIAELRIRVCNYGQQRIKTG